MYINYNIFSHINFLTTMYDIFGCNKFIKNNDTCKTCNYPLEYKACNFLTDFSLEIINDLRLPVSYYSISYYCNNPNCSECLKTKFCFNFSEINTKHIDCNKYNFNLIIYNHKLKLSISFNNLYGYNYNITDFSGSQIFPHLNKYNIKENKFSYYINNYNDIFNKCKKLQLLY